MEGGAAHAGGGVIDNAAIGAVLLEMGELMRVKGGDPHRARAFMRAAGVLVALREPVLEHLQRGQRIAGIGPGTIERVKAIGETGTCAEHQQLLQTIPRGLLAVMQLRGMGARTARVAFEHGVSDVETLELALRQGVLQRSPDFGPSLATRVLAEIERQRTPAPKLRLDEAMALGARIIEHMRLVDACVDIVQTGSVRRGAEVIGDLDFVVASRDDRAVVAQLLAFDDVESHVSGHGGFCIVRLKSGVQVDVRTVPPESFGAGVHHFTGDKQHNIQMRLRANRLGLHVSEKGVWQKVLSRRAKSDLNRQLAQCLTTGRTEVDVFSALGLPFIPVPLRTGARELELGETGRLPVLVRAHDLRLDAGIALTTLPETLALLHAHKVRQTEALIVEVDAQAANTRAPELHALRQNGARLGMFVVVVGLVHVDSDHTNLPHCDTIAVVGPAHDVPLRSAMLCAAMTKWRPLYVKAASGRALPSHPAVDVEMPAILRCAARLSVGVQLSGDPRTFDIDAASARMARDLGVRVFVASTASSAAEISQLDLALQQAQRAQLGPSDIANVDDIKHLARSAVPEVSAGEAAPETFARSRLEAFIRGQPDPELEQALSARTGNALQAAFELLSR